MIDVVTAIEDVEDVVKTKVLNDGEVGLLNLRRYVNRINGGRGLASLSL